VFNIEKLNVLFVDDDILFLKMIRQHFRQNNITLACNADQAKQYLHQRNFDVMVTDFHMPGEDGLSLSHFVRHQFPKIAIIMLSSQAFLNIPFIDKFLLKPINIRELKKQIEIYGAVEKT
jgi:two-component system phosphate regulon response regulator OmpR